MKHEHVVHKTAARWQYTYVDVLVTDTDSVLTRGNP